MKTESEINEKLIKTIGLIGNCNPDTVFGCLTPENEVSIKLAEWYYRTIKDTLLWVMN